jgi:hypothetical protein
MNAQAQTTDEPVRQPPNQMLKPRDHVSWSTMASFFFFCFLEGKNPTNLISHSLTFIHHSHKKNEKKNMVGTPD